MSVKRRSSIRLRGGGQRAPPRASESDAAGCMRTSRARAAVAAKKGTSRLSAWCERASAAVQRSARRRASAHQQVRHQRVYVRLRQRRLARQRLEVQQQHAEKHLHLLPVVRAQRDGVAGADALNDGAHLRRRPAIHIARKLRQRGWRLEGVRQLFGFCAGATARSPLLPLGRRCSGSDGGSRLCRVSRRGRCMRLLVCCALGVVAATRLPSLLLLLSLLLLVTLLLLVPLITVLVLVLLFAIAAAARVAAVLEDAESAQAAQPALEGAALLDGANALLKRCAQVVVVAFARRLLIAALAPAAASVRFVRL